MTYSCRRFQAASFGTHIVTFSADLGLVTVFCPSSTPANFVRIVRDVAVEVRYLSSHAVNSVGLLVAVVASIANKFYGQDVNLIVDFLLESDPSQFKILVGSLKNDKTAAIDRLKRELESEPEASWNDEPLDPNWRDS